MVRGREKKPEVGCFCLAVSPYFYFLPSQSKSINETAQRERESTTSCVFILFTPTNSDFFLFSFYHSNLIHNHMATLSVSAFVGAAYNQTVIVLLL